MEIGKDRKRTHLSRACLQTSASFIRALIERILSGWLRWFTVAKAVIIERIPDNG